MGDEDPPPPTSAFLLLPPPRLNPNLIPPRRLPFLLAEAFVAAGPAASNSNQGVGSGKSKNRLELGFAAMVICCLYT